MDDDQDGLRLPHEALLDADDVARILGVSRDWVYEQSRKGAIPTIALGRNRRFRREAIERWLVEQERSAASRR